MFIIILIKNQNNIFQFYILYFLLIINDYQRIIFRLFFLKFNIYLLFLNLFNLIFIIIDSLFLNFILKLILNMLKVQPKIYLIVYTYNS